MTEEEQKIEDERIVEVKRIAEEERLAKEKKSEPISIAARNLRLIKRIVLGKKKPPMFLRVLCWFNLGWSALMTFYYGIVGILLASDFIQDELLEAIGGKYFFVYSCLHIAAFIGTILIWRMKKLGFYLFSIPTFIMPFLFLIMTWKWSDGLDTKSSKIELVTFLFSIITIGLFAINWRSLNLIKKKEDEPEV